MKKLALFVVLLFSALAWAGSEPNPADYTINVHVSSSRRRYSEFLKLKVLIDGKKYEMQALDGEDSLLALGDYKARTVEVRVKDAHPYDVHTTYEILFPDKKTRRYALTGIME